MSGRLVVVGSERVRGCGRPLDRRARVRARRSRQCVQGVCKGRESAPTQKTEALDRDGCGVGPARQDEVPAEEDRRHLRDTAVEEESRALSSRPAERHKTKGGRWASWSNLSTCGCCLRAKPVGSDHAASVPRGRRLSSTRQTSGATPKLSPGSTPAYAIAPKVSRFRRSRPLLRRSQ